MNKPRVAIFKNTDCAGCELQIVNLEENIIDLLGVVDVVSWQEAMKEHSDDYDIAIIEGSVTTEREAEKMKKIREKAKIVIAMGTCACSGGINCCANDVSIEEKKRVVYKENAEKIEGLRDAIQPRPISAVIKVDAAIPGCPINNKELVEAIKCLLLGKKVKLPNYPVCVECAMKENGCLFDSGITCLGPITKAGCEAICASNRKECWGCRGFVDNPNENAAKDILEKYGLTVKDIKNKFEMFNACAKEAEYGKK
jgi:sulfhydrogenase subunit delta